MAQPKQKRFLVVEEDDCVQDVVKSTMMISKRRKSNFVKAISFAEYYLEVKKEDKKVTCFRFYKEQILLCCSKVYQSPTNESELSICLANFSTSFGDNNIFHMNMEMIKSYLIKEQNAFSIKTNVSKQDFGSFIDKTCMNSFDVSCPEVWKGKSHYKVLKDLLKKEEMGCFACPLESFVVNKSFVFY